MQSRTDHKRILSLAGGTSGNRHTGTKNISIFAGTHDKNLGSQVRILTVSCNARFPTDEGRGIAGGALILITADNTG